jgi:hypothetical protein
MKKLFYAFLSLMMCMFTSCKENEDIVPEPEPEQKPLSVKEAVYETNDDYVDLGFDGIMFATKNLGAKKPEDSGYYFAWGETEPKDEYSWNTYKWTKEIKDPYTNVSFSKYYTKSNGKPDFEYLQPEDDAATVMLGEGWRMPTCDEVKLLQDSYAADLLACRVRTTLRNGVYGYELIGLNGNSIFIPSTGVMRDNELTYWDYDTKLWCSDIQGMQMRYFEVNSLEADLSLNGENRCCGLPIRAVKVKKERTDTVFLKYNVLERNIEQARERLATINAADYSAESYQTLDKAYQHAVYIKAFAKENDGQLTHKSIYVINEVNEQLQDSINFASHNLRLAMVDLQPLPKPSDIKAVDLGLSVRWASANLGARTEAENGYYIAWGELTPKEGRYDWDSYNMFSKYITDSKWGEVDGKTRLDLEDDAAHDYLGGNWRIPTPEQFQELVDKCTFENVGLYGRTVMRATGPNGNYIYFPHAGTTSVTDQIYCWTSDMSPGANNHAICYRIDSFWGTANKTWEDRCVGMTIRAVCP